MTTGASIYLVSACSSGEEFVAAFRRYADRTGLFIPVPEPLAAGRRGRLALTLKDGGVMIEGEAEVIASSPSPSALHGRIGMTIRFVEPDEPSKIVLGELEKARLAMKPAPPSVPPRPSAIPATPRPVAPAPGGRIDANNALAECVMIGDASELRDGGGTRSAGGTIPPKASQKFVVPAIPTGPARAKTPSTAPVTGAPPEPRAKTPSIPPEPAADVRSVKATTLGMAAIARPDPTPAAASQKATDPPAPQPAVVTPVPTTTVPGVAPKSAQPIAARAVVRKDPTPVPMGTVPGVVAAKDTAAARTGTGEPPARNEPADARPNRQTVIGPAVAPPRVAEPIAPTTPTRDDPTTPLAQPPRAAAMPQGRSKSATSPPRFPTPVAPLPVTRLPAHPAPPIVAKPAAMPVEVDLAEPTDLNTVPTPPEPRTTSGEQPVPFEVPTVDSGRAFIDAPPAPSAATDPPVFNTTRASQILAAIPSGGDWTMTPDASAPTVLPSAQKRDSNEETPATARVSSGDWTISLTSDGDAAWSEPQKVEPIAAVPVPRKPSVAATPKTGNPVFAVASDKPLNSEAPEDRPTAIEPKVEIDPTLMEPLEPMPTDEDDEPDELAPPPMPAPGPIPPPLAPMPMPMHVPMELRPVTGQGQAYATPPPGSLQYPMGQHAMPPAMDPRGGQMMGQMAGQFGQGQMGGASFPPPPQRSGMGFDSGRMPQYPAEPTAAIDPNQRKRKKIVLVTAAAVIVTIIVIIALLGSGKDQRPAANGSGSAATIIDPGSRSVTAGSGSGSQQVAVTDPARAETKAPDAGVAAATKCTIEVTSVPPGAEVALDSTKDHVLGTTPGTFELPCDTETKLYVRKAKYNGVVKSVTAAAKPATVAIKMSKQTFALKVTSTPAGATITIGGKSMGVTPTTIRVPAYETAAITVSKDGYTPDTQKITVKTNSGAHHVPLKKLGGGAKKPR
ncbi:MAG: Heat shock protein Hsp70 family protein [Myxococcales bacterium]|nr:Heat shock protein Hsp70 family protein [Myxococcales bacterium]